MKRLLLILAGAAPLCAQVDPSYLQTLLTRHRPENRAFEFALIGDQQYGTEGIAKWPALQASMNAATSLQFIVHDGDIKNGSSLCDDAMYQNRLASLEAFEAPLIYTPGDNEWTDCHRANNGAYDPIERLSVVRRTFFPSNESLGKKKMTLSRQSDIARFALYRENALWTMGNVVFATVHIVGSNNNLNRNAANDAEYEARNAANLNWIQTAFSLARDGGFSAVMLIIQANPQFELGPAAPERAGFNDSLFILEQETLVFAPRPVVLVHGDSHYFRIDKPFLGAKSGRPIESFTRVETFGETQAHWTRVRVNPSNRNVFEFDQEIVQANVFAHPR